MQIQQQELEQTTSLIYRKGTYVWSFVMVSMLKIINGM